MSLGLIPFKYLNVAEMRAHPATKPNYLHTTIMIQQLQVEVFREQPMRLAKRMLLSAAAGHYCVRTHSAL
jgi:hypothetical protein